MTRKQIVNTVAEENYIDAGVLLEDIAASDYWFAKVKNAINNTMFEKFLKQYVNENY